MDNQDLVRVHVTQGERDMAEDNRSLGRMEMFGIPPSPRGLPEIEVSFEIDANGIMSVRAKDLGTGQAQSMRIVSSSGLSDTEIQKTLSEADTYREQDAERRDIAEAKNTLDGLIYTTRRSLDEYGGGLSVEDRDHIKETIAYAEQCIDASDIEVVQDAHDRLALAAQRLAESIYEAAHEGLDEELSESFDESWDEDEDDLFDEDLGL